MKKYEYEYTQLKIYKPYREKLLKLAEAENRSMANLVQTLIDEAYAKWLKKQPKNNVPPAS